MELRVAHSNHPLTDAWRGHPVEPRGSTLLGISFRPLQAEALGLDVRAALQSLLAYPYGLIRLGAYWNRIEAEPGRFDATELDWQIDAAERAGKQIVLAVGAVKTFGYPEVFVPSHWLAQPLRERPLVQPGSHPALLLGAEQFIGRIVTRYRDRQSIVAWQLEHEAVDPLGVEHSWRLSRSFVERELQALRAADPSRPVMMNGFLPTSSVVRLSQWWRTRDQGDSLAVAGSLADIVGIDYYPRTALRSLGHRTLYLDGAEGRSARTTRTRVFGFIRGRGKRLMIVDGQAEPWESSTYTATTERRSWCRCAP